MLSTLDVVRALVGIPVSHPPAFPHRDPVLGITWTDDTPLETEHVEGVPETPGVLAIVQGGVALFESIVWAEACNNVRARLLEMLVVPQDPPLARILARGNLRFRTSCIAEPERREEIVRHLTQALSHLPPPQSSAMMDEECEELV
jgi:hypothetical protein